MILSPMKGNLKMVYHMEKELHQVNKEEMKDNGYTVLTPYLLRI